MKVAVESAPVLLPYQQRSNATIAATAVTVIEKSRRIGLTWGVAAQAVLTGGAAKSADGMNVLYIGYKMELAREFIDGCGMWARAFAAAADAAEEWLFDDGDDRSILAYRITFASGFKIIALSSRPRSLRGHQGMVVIDEAAFHDQLPELLKAALAMLIWGGKVVVISTHDGAENPFAELVEDCRAGRKPYALIRITFDDALRDGLYKRICAMTGKEWSQEAEDAWAAEIRAFYSEGASEELDVIPSQGGGRYIPLSIINQNIDDTIPVIRWGRKRDWATRPDDERIAEADAFLDDEIRPLLDGLSKRDRTVFGMDFARFVDLSVIWPLVIDQSMRSVAPFIVELRDIPFQQQQQILFFILRRLPRFSGGAMDAGGNGAALTERTQQNFGYQRVEAVNFSTEWYRTNMPLWKASLEDRLFAIPRDRDVVDDFRQVRLVKGVARVPEKRQTGEDGGQRHGDAAIAAALAEYAARRDPWEADYEPVPAEHPLFGDASNDDHDMADAAFGRRWPRGRGW